MTTSSERTRERRTRPTEMGRAAAEVPVEGRRHARYAPWQRQMVRERYPLCRTLHDKEQLAADAQIGSLQKLYNLASRLKVTQTAGGGNSAERGLNEAMDVARDPRRWRIREDPRETEFSERDDQYLREHFGRQEIAAIALQCDHTEIAMSYRARKLGLRGPVRWWDMSHVLAWLGVSADELREMGVPLYPCCDRRGRIKIILVSTEDLVRVLTRGGRWQRLVAERDSDLFFITEVIESQLAVRGGHAEWEGTWVSHGHTCLNPFSGLSFGLFYDGNDKKLLGAHFTPSDLAPNSVLQLA